jgi:flagella basal body P-ring formation protein FlgA
VAFTRFQINELLRKAAPEMVCSNWTGAERVRVLRATRVIDEFALRSLLTQELQSEHVKDRGDLELAFTRPWTSMVVVDDPVAVKVLELPLLGVTSSFVCRFELMVGNQSAGVFQQPMKATVWRDVYVAKSSLTRGTLLRDADVGTEKRDILTLREGLTSLPLNDPNIELRENVQAGTPLTQQMFRLRAIIKRGKLVEATVQDDTMTISMRAEALEDGVRGQVVRLRNPVSRREFKGKVQDEQTVVVLF